MEQCTVIHLFREGTFYRAYEWSAWLFLRYFTELKVTHRLLKSGDDIVFVGFPLTSFDRYTPQGALVSPSGDKSVELTLPVEAFAPDVDCESLQKGFDDWKQCQPMTETSKKKVEEGRVEAGRNAHPRLTDIMLRILAYPRSPEFAICEAGIPAFAMRNKNGILASTRRDESQETR